MPLSKKDYIAVAEIINTARKNNNDLKTITESLADYFQGDNEKFNRQKFLNACGVEVV